jgi:hypothetical protein
MLLSFMELLEQKKTAQPQENDPKDDLLDHWRTQVSTIEPKPRRRRRRLWLKDESLEAAPTNQRSAIRCQKVSHDFQAALAQFAEIASDLKH